MYGLERSFTVMYGLVRSSTEMYGYLQSCTVWYGFDTLRYATATATLKKACGYSITDTDHDLIRSSRAIAY
jgi:hypothetical protein